MSGLSVENVSGHPEGNGKRATRIAVVGAGSIGLLLAAKLSRAPSVRVAVVARTAEQAACLARDGLRMTEEGQTVASAVHALSYEQLPPSDQSRAEDETPSWDWVFLTVKQTHITGELIDRLKGMLGAGGKLLCFQNGIGHLERLAEEGVPRERLYAAVTTEAAKKTEACRVIHTGIGKTIVGCADPLRDGGEAEELARVLSGAGLDCGAVPDIETHMWRKLLFNSIINPLTAILGVRNGELPNIPEGRRLMESLFEEGASALRKAGRLSQADDGLWDDLLRVCERTSANTSSMLQDIAAGRRTEIDWINGSLIRLGSEYGIGLPVNRTVYLLVKSLERRGDGPSF